MERRAILLVAILAVALMALFSSGIAFAATAPPPISQATMDSPPMIYQVGGSPAAITKKAGTAALKAPEGEWPFPFNIGYVQHRPHVHLIFWGSEWNEAPGTREKMIGLFQWLSGSTYAKILTQYFDHAGYITGETDLSSYTDTRVKRPPLVSTTDLKTEINYSIEHQPGWGSTSYEDQFIVLTPQGTPVPEGFCGYHLWEGAPWQVAGAYVPWSSPGCRRGLEPWGAMQVTASHEWAEMSTDPIPLDPYWGWARSTEGGEVADLCNDGTAAEHAEVAPGIFGAKLLDDYLWSATGQFCVAQDAAPIRFTFTTGQSVVGLHTATITGAVNPGGWQNASYQFAFTGPGGTTYFPPRNESPQHGFASLGNKGFADVGVSAEVSGLKGSTTYHVRLSAFSSLTEPRVPEEFGVPQIFDAPETQFTTPDWRPGVSGESVANRSQAGATLQATIRPEGTATSYHFEYGPTAGYGASIPVPDAAIGSGAEPVPVSQDISGLKPETAYHYRVVATNTEGTTVGKDNSFTTLGRPATFVAAFGTLGAANGQLNSPKGVAVDPSGNVWVADTENNRIEKFNAEGKYIGQFGTKGSGNGQFNKPQDLTFGPPNGTTVWVTDAGNHRIQEFNLEGKYIFQNGTAGTGPNQFVEPSGIVFAGGTLWVSDPGSNRLERYNPMGQYTGEVQNGFSQPSGLATDAAGHLWVADTGNNRLQEFAGGSGAFVGTIGSGGSGEGQLNAPTGIGVRPSGNLWVAERGNNRIQELSPSGEYLASFGSKGTEKGQFSEPRDVAVGPGGVEYVTDLGNARVQKLSQPRLSEATTQAVSNVKSREVTLNGAVNPSGLATTYRFEYGSTTSYGTSIPVLEETAGSGVEPIIKSQTIKALQPEQVYHYRIVATNAEGATYGQDVRFITTAVPTFNLAIGSSGSGSGQLNRPTGVAVDSTGNLWVADTENNRIEKFNAEGKYIGQFGTKGSGNGQFNKPQDLAFSGSNLWVTDSGNHRLQKFNAEGKYLEQLGSEGTGPGQFIEPYGVTIAEGHIWVSDAGDDRLVEFNSMGKYTREVHGAGYGGSLTGEVNNPTGIASGPDGQIWVADTGNNRVEQFGPEGEYLSTIGKPMDIVQFTAPYGIAVRPSGNLVISEQGADQVQVVLPTGEFLTQYGTNGSGPGQMSDPTGIDLGECGVEYLSDTGNARVEQWDRPTGPEAMTKEASTMISHQAVLRGAVNPCGLATTYRFEYGQTTAYGKSIPIPDESAGSGSQSLTMSKTVTGLMPLTYHFRVVATNSEGSSYGKDETFKVH